MDRYEFANGREAQEIVTEYRREYNGYRPHSSLGYLTPAEFAAAAAPLTSAAQLDDVVLPVIRPTLSL